MKNLLKIYSASCLVVLGFFTFFLIPWGLLPFSDAANIITVGAMMVGLSTYYVGYSYRREELDLGWFLANRGGFWAIATAVLGLIAIACGGLLYFWPELYVPAFEQGALPFGIAIVSLFWLALIFMFAYLTFGMVARATAQLRLFRFAGLAVNGLVALMCLGLAGLFFSLYVEVINDIAIRISTTSQRMATWIFMGTLVAAGIVYGFWEKPSYYFATDKSVE